MNSENTEKQTVTAVALSWSSIPTELLCLILSQVDMKTLTSALSVNLQWNSVQSFPEIWRDALIQENFISVASTKLKDENWRDYATSFAQTRRNIQKKLVVIDTLCTSHGINREWHPSFERTALMLRTTWGRWAAINRFNTSASGDNLSQLMSGDLWDMNGRTLLQKFSTTILVAAGYLLIVRTAKNAKGDDLFSLKYESLDTVRKLAGQTIRVTKSVSFVKFCDLRDLKTIHNTDDSSPYACFYYKRKDNGQYVIRIFDLDQKKSVFVTNTALQIPTGLYGKTFTIHHKDSGYSYVYPDILQPKTVHKVRARIVYMESPTTGWTLHENTITKTDVTTGKLNEAITVPITGHYKTYRMTIFQNMYVVGVGDQYVIFFDRKTREVIRTVYFGAQKSFQEYFDFHPMYSGKLVFSNTEHLSVISFLDKDVNQKLQMVKLKHGGKLEVVDVVMGKFHSTISQSKCFYYSLTFYHEDKWKRYSIVNNCIKNQKPVNKLATWLLQHRPVDGLAAQLHKCEVFRQFFMDTKANKVMDSSKVNKNLAFGTAWIFFEELTGSPLPQWKKAVPKDNWQFVKDRLSATAVKQFVDSVMKKANSDETGSSGSDPDSSLDEEASDSDFSEESI